MGGRPRKRNKPMTTSPTPEDAEHARPPSSALWSVQGRLWPVADDPSSRGVLAFIKRAINPEMLVTDENAAYNAVGRIIHCVIQHSERRWRAIEGVFC